MQEFGVPVFLETGTAVDKQASRSWSGSGKPMMTVSFSRSEVRELLRIKGSSQNKSVQVGAVLALLATQYLTSVQPDSRFLFNQSEGRRRMVLLVARPGGLSFFAQNRPTPHELG
jgi:hypothetical protein